MQGAICYNIPWAEPIKGVPKADHALKADEKKEPGAAVQERAAQLNLYFIGFQDQKETRTPRKRTEAPGSAFIILKGLMYHPKHKRGCMGQYGSHKGA